MYSYVKINGTFGAVETNLINDGKLYFPIKGRFAETDGSIEFEIISDESGILYAFESDKSEEEVLKLLRGYGEVSGVGDNIYIVSTTDTEIVRNMYLGVEHLPEKMDDIHIKVFARYMETLGIKTVKFLTV